MDLFGFPSDIYYSVATAAKQWWIVRLVVATLRWLRLWLPRPWPDLMTIEEAAVYAGVSSSKVRRTGKMHPEMVQRDGNGRNPRYVRREVRRLLKKDPKRAKPNR